MIGGHNPGVHGAVLTEALASRFAVQIQVATDYDLARSLKIEPSAITRRPQPRHPPGQRRDRLGTPAPRAHRLRARSPRVLGPDAAVANLAGIAPEEDRDVVTDDRRQGLRPPRHPPRPRPPDLTPPPARKDTRAMPAAAHLAPAPAAPPPARRRLAGWPCQPPSPRRSRRSPAATT